MRKKQVEKDEQDHHEKKKEKKLKIKQEIKYLIF